MDSMKSASLPFAAAELARARGVNASGHMAARVRCNYQQRLTR
jgi:hypothetical protein